MELSEELVELEEGSEVKQDHQHYHLDHILQPYRIIHLLKVGTLECSSDARPAASIVWTKAGEEIATGTELTFPGSISRWRYHLEKQRGFTKD